MNRKYLIPLLILGLLSLLLTGCPKSVDEKIRESTNIGVFDEATHAVDRALDIQVEQNIRSDLELRWFADAHGLNVEVSHSVVTVFMTVKTDELRDRALALAAQDDRVREVIDEIVVDHTVEGAPFEW
jgi:osmotically-inducible protein OsmY